MKTLIITIITMLITCHSFAQDIEDSPFGFHPAGIFKPGYQNNGFADAESIGVKWTRQGVNAFWFLIQPDLNETTFDFTMYDQQWLAVPEGMNILANIAPQGNIDEGYCEPGSYLPIDSTKYVRFVRATVERYDGDGIDDMPGLVNPIRRWQVGNEPNARILSGFAELQRLTYQAIKSACSDCVVLNGGIAGLGMISGSDYVTNFETDYKPILTALAGQYVDVFDFHWYGNATGDYRLRNPDGGQDVLAHLQAALAETGFPDDMPIWITEMGSYSGDPGPMPFPPFSDLPFQTEGQQAGDFVKRHVYSLAWGVKKIFPAFGLIEGFKYDDGYFDYTGLIYDGTGSNDLGLGVKKLAYFSYKLMTEKLEGSNWDNIQTLTDGTDNVYAYKFTRAETGEPVYVAWWDWFDEPGYSEGDTKIISIEVGDVDSVRVTRAVPDAESGVDLNENDYPAFFTSETRPVINGAATITLGENPVFVEPLATPTSVGDETGSPAPEGFRLAQNYPNPFNPQTTIEYQIPNTGHVALRIFNVQGQEVRTLVDENRPAGIHSVPWDSKDNLGKAVSSNLYFIQLRADEFIQTKKLLLLR